MRKSLPFFKHAYDAGYAAYKNGIVTVKAAKLANPYRLFGHRIEHAQAVSWNKGWNAASRDAKSRQKE